MLNLWDWQRQPLSCVIQTASLIGTRKENQDNYVIVAADSTGQVTAQRLNNGNHSTVSRSDWPAHMVRLALLDGMGGHDNGREIAEAAALELCSFPHCHRLKHQLQRLLHLHNKLQQQFTKITSRNPGTTLIWAEIDLKQRICNLIHVGDSRAWLWNGDTWQQLTHDHTLVEFKYRDGHLNTVDYAMQNSKTNQRIAQALGYGSWSVYQSASNYAYSPDLRLDTVTTLPEELQDHADVFTLPLTEKSALILASDGLWNNTSIKLPDVAALATLDTAQNMVQTAITAGSQDNTTVVICVFTSELRA